MSYIGQLIQTYQDKHGASDRALARRIDASPTLIGKWKRGEFKEIPGRDRLDALSAQIAVDYDVLLEAFLRDAGYWRETGDGDDRSAAPMTAEGKIAAYLDTSTPKGEARKGRAEGA